MKQRLIKLVSYLESGLIERAEPARLSLLAALSGEHLLLLGPPGTAKSELARKLHRVFSNARYFERLLTRFSVPEELFGPLSIKALEEDRYQRLTKNYLPDASVAFIDEIFKSNSAILNSLLTLLNEREFDNGCERLKTPLICVIAASNELPEEAGLDALYDRFLIRYQVMPVSDNGFTALLQLPAQRLQPEQLSAEQLSPESPPLEAFSTDDIRAIQQKSQAIALKDDAVLLLQRLRQYLQVQSIYISDRRWRKAIKLLQVCAYTSGRKSVSVWDCTILAHIMWQSPQQLDGLSGWFIDAFNLDIDAVLKRLRKLVSSWETQLNEDQQKKNQKTNAMGELLYKREDGSVTTQNVHVIFAERNGETLYLAPPDIEDRSNKNRGYTLEELESTFFDKSYKQTHIEGRWIDVQNYINNTQNRLVERQVFEPIMDEYYFSGDYISNQQEALETMLGDIVLISRDFEQLVSDIKQVLGYNIWLSCGLLDNAAENIASKLPQLVELQQSVIRLKKINTELAVR